MMRMDGKMWWQGLVTVANAGSRKSINLAKRAIDLVIRFMSEQKTLQQVPQVATFLLLVPCFRRLVLVCARACEPTCGRCQGRRLG